MHNATAALGRSGARRSLSWLLVVTAIASCAPQQGQTAQSQTEIEKSLTATEPVLFQPAPLPAPTPIPVPFPNVTWSLSDFPTETGRILTPDTIITMADGTQRRADRAIEILNLAEDEVNEVSSTLTGGLDSLGQEVELPGTGGVTTTKIPALYTLPLDLEGLDNQREDFIDRYQPIALDRVPNVDDFVAPHEGEGSNEDNPTVPDSGTDEPCEDKNESVSDHWSDGWGDRKILWVGLSADVALTGTPQAATLDAGGGASGKLFGAGFDIVTGQGSFVGPASGSGTGNVRITVLDKDLYNGATHPGSHHEGDYNSPFNSSVTIPVAKLLGIVDVTAKVGVKGAAGARFDATTTSLVAKGHVTPYAYAIGYAKAFAGPKIDLGIVKAKLEVGVGGELTFLDERLKVRGNIHKSSDQCVRFKYSYKGKNAMRALAGKLYVFARAKGCFLGKCVGDHWRWNLFKWDGIGPFESVVFRGEN